MKDIFTLDEAAVFLGLPVETLRTKTKRGELAYTTTLKGKRQVKVIEREVLLSYGKQDGPDYDALLTQYLQEHSVGLISGKPVSAKYIQRIKDSLKRYWVTLGLTPSIEAITAANFRKFLSLVEIDDENQRDYHATKESVKSALSGFMRLLVREGYKTADEQRELMGIKLRRKYKNRHEYPDDKAVANYIDRNQAWVVGRSALDRHIMHVLLMLYSHAGIRKMEAAKLKVSDIDFNGNALRLWGKGGKRRFVPMVPELAAALKDWVETQRPNEERPELILNNERLPLTESAIGDRFTRFSKHVGKRVHPHGLRHACATILAKKGMPTVLIKEMLGHELISTTNIYLNTDEKDLFEWFSRPKEDVVIPDTPKKKKSLLNW